MDITLTTAIDVEFLSLTGEVFQVALSGDWNDDGSITKSWLASPKVKYYYPFSPLFREEDKRQFFLCVQDSTNEEDTGLKEVVGMIELQESPYDCNVMWMKYITVREDMQRCGIAKKLISMMISFLKEKPHRLERSYATDEGKVKIKSYIDQELNKEGISWTQSRS